MCLTLGSDQDGSAWAQTGGENDQFDHHFLASGSHSAPTTTAWCLRGMVEVPDDDE